MDNNSTDKFFENLARYYWHENDLSNITVALCNASKCFKEKFLHFFFKNIVIDDVTDIAREVWNTNGAGSRVDIHISTKSGQLYIIEVKINDLNHHPEYSSNYNVDQGHYGYITNYTCAKDFEATFRTWGEFYDSLNKVINELDDLSKGYMTYLKRVCKIKRYTTPMNFSNIRSIRQLLDTVNLIIEKNPDINPAIKIVPYNNTTDVQKLPLVIARRFGICNTSGNWLLNGYVYINIDEQVIGFSVNGDFAVMDALGAYMKVNSDCWGYPADELSPEQMEELNNTSLKNQENLLETRLSTFINRVVMALKDTQKI